MTLIGLSILFAGTSCVSKKKYVYSENQVERLQRDSAQFITEVAKLQSELTSKKNELVREKTQADKEIASLMSQLVEQGTELSEKEVALKERAYRLSALEDRLNSQQRIVNELRQTVEDALVNVKSEDLSIEVKNGKVYVSLSDKLLFPSGSANLNKGGKEAIGKLGKVLNDNPKINIDIVGHTDSIPISTPKYADNWELSTARATTITRLLTEEYKVGGTRLTASGMSDYSPVASNATKEGRAKNRRTEIVLTPKLEELFKILSGTSKADQ